MEQLMDTIENEDTMHNKYLLFTLGEAIYGLEIMYVTEIVGIQKITELPESPRYIKGVMNLRGSVIPVMDIRSRFGLEVLAYNDRTCIIVIQVHGLELGVVVDSVSEVLTMHESNILPPPVVGTVGEKYIKNVGKYNERVVLMIDCDVVLSLTEVEDIKALQ